MALDPVRDPLLEDGPVQRARVAKDQIVLSRVARDLAQGVVEDGARPFRSLGLPLLEDVPQARFSYDLSPMAVVVKKEERKWYDFITSMCGVIGGTFTQARALGGSWPASPRRVTMASVCA